MKVVWQLIKEFSIPFLGALAWVAFDFNGDLKQAITLFGGTFFFLSWLTGQIFRVRKQNATEASLLAIREDINDLLGDLKEKTDDLVGHVTGGPSYCYVFPMFLQDIENPRVGICNGGKEYPVYDVSARIVDLDIFNKLEIGPHNIFAADSYIPNIPMVSPQHMSSTPLILQLGNADRRSFNIFLSARNDTYVQLLRFARVNGFWMFALQVTRKHEDKPCYEMVMPDFPRNQAGEVDWNDLPPATTCK